MKVLITGASGLIGTALTARLRRDGHEIVSLSRSPAAADDHVWVWNPETGEVDARVGEGMDGVVHLAGENLAAGRWTDRRKARIRASRVLGTDAIAGAIARLPRKPRVVVGASATGFYGDRGEEICTEESGSGTGFLAGVCREWEAAWQPVEDRGVRVVRLRIGMVLAQEGGALAKLVPVFRWGLGGGLGSGRQYWSWIHLEDLVRAVIRAMEDEALVGAVNVVSPDSVTNRTFTRELASALRRPAWLPAPRWGLRLLLGEMADAILLSGARVVPKKLQDLGFEFGYPTLRAALRRVLAGG